MRNGETQQIIDVTEVILDSPWHLKILKAVRELNLSDWMIGAGFVRNAIWDQLHGFAVFTPLADIDVIYFDSARLNASEDTAIEFKLNDVLPDVPWSVRNQARMHTRNGDQAYASSEDAVRHWLETPTSTAVRLENDGTLSVIAPHGLGDLLGLDVRPTPSGVRKPEIYDQRIRTKDWGSTWPKLKIITLNDAVSLYPR